MGTKFRCNLHQTADVTVCVAHYVIISPIVLNYIGRYIGDVLYTLAELLSARTKTQHPLISVLWLNYNG